MRSHRLPSRSRRTVSPSSRTGWQSPDVTPRARSRPPSPAGPTAATSTPPGNCGSGRAPRLPAVGARPPGPERLQPRASGPSPSRGAEAGRHRRRLQGRGDGVRGRRRGRERALGQVSVTGADPVGAEITAPSIGSVSAKGNFAGDITATDADGGIAAGKPVPRVVTVGRELTGGTRSGQVRHEFQKRAQTGCPLSPRPAVLTCESDRRAGPAARHPPQLPSAQDRS